MNTKNRNSGANDTYLLQQYSSSMGWVMTEGKKEWVNNSESDGIAIPSRTHSNYHV